MFDTESIHIMQGKGKKDSKIVILSEYPKSGDFIDMEPFSGSDGRLLKSLMFRAGVLWDDCYITHVIKEKSSPSDVSKFISFKRSGEAIHKGNFDKYIELLREELLELKPNVVLATGDIALYALTGETGVSLRRGSIMESKLVPGLKVIPCIHPSSASRQYMFQYYIFHDLQRLKEEAKFSYIKVLPYSYHTDPTFEEALSYLEKCKKSELLSYDIEVGGFKDNLSEVSCISFSKDDESAISIPFTRDGKNRWSPENELIIWDTINEILTNKDIRKVAQNRFFDGHFLFWKYGIIVENCEDTMIAQALLRPDFPKGLDFINSMYCDIGYYKVDGKEFFGGRGNLESFWLYNAKDSMVLSVAFPKMEKELRERGLYETYQAQNGIVDSLIFMSFNGMKIDVDGLVQKSKEAAIELEKLEKLFYSLAGREVNLRSPKQLQELFYGPKKNGGLGLPPYKNKDGNPTTDEGALIRLSRPLASRPAVPHARVLLEHRKLSKLRGTYYEMSYDEDGRLRSSMNPVGTRTGRLSSSENIFGTGTNVQNQPYAMKEFFLIDDGYIGYNIDLSQAENRIVAYVAPEPKLIEAFENGIDIHSRTASYIFQKHEKEISKEEGSAPQFGNGDQSERYWGKKANHAFNYGQSANAFAMQMLISSGEAQTIFYAYHNAYPGVTKYHNFIKGKLTEDRTLTNLFGRRYTFLNRWDYSLFLEAFAFIPQSTIADIINRWGLAPIYYTMPDVMLLNQIHDSIVFQISKKVPLEKHAEYLLKIRDNLTQELSWNGRTFRIPCDIKVMTKNMMEGSEFKLNATLCQEELTEKLRSLTV